MSVIIGEQNRPFGVLGAHTAKRRTFSQDDVNFFQAVANLLGEAIERTKAEEVLQESEERYRTVAETATDSIITVDEDDKIVFANPATEGLFGYTVNELLNQPLTMLLPKTSREAHQTHLQRYLETGTRSVSWCGREVIAIHKTGREIPVELSIGEMSENGRHRFTGIIRDISERKLAEAERASLESQMQHSQKLESLGVLAGGIAHDFNNLLAGVLGNAGLIRNDLPTDSPAWNRVNRITDAATHAAELCKQLLAYAGKGQFVVEPIDVKRVVADTRSLLRTSISKSARLELNLADDLPNIEADETQLRQILMNLITNASDALGDSGGSISVTTGTIVVDHSWLTEIGSDEDIVEGRHVFIEVSDTGCGMDEETKARIFDPFFTTKFAGRGLGLAAVQGIMRGQQGAVLVESTPGQGTIFKVLFPVSEKLETKPAASGPPKSTLRGTGTVLVVDDEEIVRTIVEDALQCAGFRVLLAGDPERRPPFSLRYPSPHNRRHLQLRTFDAVRIAAAC